MTLSITEGFSTFAESRAFEETKGCRLRPGEGSGFRDSGRRLHSDCHLSLSCQSHAQRHQKPGEQSRLGLRTLSLGPPVLTGKQVPKFAPTLCQPQVPGGLQESDTGALQVLAGALTCGLHCYGKQVSEG